MEGLKSARRAGDLHSETRLQRQVGGFVLTEGVYPPAMHIRRHDHEPASLCIVMTGGYDERFGAKTRRATPGCVIVHPAGEHHAEVHDAVCTRLLTIEIEPGLLRDLRPATRALDEPWHREDFAVAAVASRVCRDLDDEDASAELDIESTILEMLATLDRRRTLDSTGARWLSRVRDCLEASPASPPGMRRLAELAGVHPMHLARVFRRQFGCSVGAYARRLRVGRAVALLQEGALELAAIAQETGFADQSHMTRLVLAQTGLTPGAWRRRSRRR